MMAKNSGGWRDVWRDRESEIERDSDSKSHSHLCDYVSYMDHAAHMGRTSRCERRDREASKETIRSSGTESAAGVLKLILRHVLFSPPKLPRRRTHDCQFPNLKSFSGNVVNQIAQV